MKIFISIWFHFPLAWRTSLYFLIAHLYCRLILSTFFILSSFLKYIFAGYRILDWLSPAPFITLKAPSLSLSLIFSSLTIILLPVVFLVFILLKINVTKVEFVNLQFPLTLGNFRPFFFQIFFIIHFHTLSLRDTNYIYVRPFYIVLSISESSVYFFFQILVLTSSDRIIFINLSLFFFLLSSPFCC